MTHGHTGVGDGYKVKEAFRLYRMNMELTDFGCGCKRIKS